MASDDLGLAHPSAQAAEGDVRAALEQVLAYLEGQNTKTKSNGVFNAHARRTICGLLALSAEAAGTIVAAWTRAPETDEDISALGSLKAVASICIAKGLHVEASIIWSAIKEANRLRQTLASEDRRAEEMRERAANTAELIGQSYESAWRQDRKADPYLQGCADTADEVATAIRALPPSSSPEDQQKAAATPTIADPVKEEGR